MYDSYFSLVTTEIMSNIRPKIIFYVVGKQNAREYMNVFGIFGNLTLKRMNSINGDTNQWLKENKKTIPS